MLSWFDRLAIAVTGLVLLAVLGIELGRVQGSLPYPQHVDERPVLNAAAQMLKTGSWNPHLYQYPSLPLYIATGALGLGVISASGRGPDKLSTQQLGRLAGAAYEHPEVVGVVRRVWASMGVVTIAAVAAIGFQLGGGVGLLLTAALALVGTKIRVLASGYINVDTPAAMFAALCMLQLVMAIDRRGDLDKLWLPAFFCGASMACKYNALIVLVPCVLSVVLFSERRRLRRSLAIVLAAVASFVVLCPFFLLDFNHFVDGLAGVAYHYGVLGHRRFSVEPGLPHLALIANDVTEDYGHVLAALALLGCVPAAGLDGRRALLVASLPVASAWSMSRYQVHFGRNSLILLSMIPVLAACGVPTLWGLLARVAAQLARIPRFTRLGAPRIALVLGIVAGGALIASLPVANVIKNFRAAPDSRNAFVRWAQRNLDANSVLLVPTSLPFDDTRLRDKLEIRALDLRNADDTQLKASIGSYLLLPHWNDSPGGAARHLAQLAPGLGALPPHTLVQSFEGRRIRPIDDRDTQCVNPGFDLVRLTARP